MKKSNTRSIPFEFVLDQLYLMNPEVKPMFGCFAIYRQNKIVLILRKKEELKYDNGVWVATTHEHHASLKTEFPSMRSVRLLGGNVTAWQNIPSDTEDFEEVVMKICDLIRKGDPRIGKVPKSRKKPPKS